MFTLIPTRSSAGADKPARRDVRYRYSGQSTVGFRYIFCNYGKAYCAPSTAVRSSASDVTSPTTAARFNRSACHILQSDPHSDCLQLIKIFMTAIAMRGFLVEFESNDRRSGLSYWGGKSVGNYGWEAVSPQICVHPHIETDRKYNARDIFDAVQFCGIIGN